ncbi:MAG: DUF2997 domain-containing protein [Desulfobacterales bacterium]|nr:DUF2997 domain-containing protein [Desulfobacterales bacterium]
MKEIIVDISSEGDVKIETRGFEGKSCIAESEFLKELLGKEVEKQLTPAYFYTNKSKTKKYLPICG